MNVVVEEINLKWGKAVAVFILLLNGKLHVVGKKTRNINK